MTEKDPKVMEVDSDDDSDQELNKTANPSGKILNRAEKKSRKAIAKLGLKPFGTGKDSGSSDSKATTCKGKIIRVTVKKQKSILFVISQPDVFKSQSGEYVIFGEARIEDMSQSNSALRNMAGGGGGMGGMPNLASMMSGMNPALAAKLGNMSPQQLAKAQAAAQAAMSGGASGNPLGEGLGLGSGSSEGATVEEVDEEAGDSKKAAGGEAAAVEEKDVELVVTQVGCSREKAIAALKANRNDIVEAIMSFNM